MTTTEAIKQLQTEHDLIAGERDLDGSQFAPALLEALAMAIEVLQGNGDTISRKQAIDVLKGLPTWWADSGGYYGGAQPPMEALLDPEDAISALENLPSAQPEVIRCRDCVRYGEPECLMAYDEKQWAEADGFCHAGERGEQDG